MDIGAAAERVATELRSLGNPQRAAAERAYLKSSAQHYGTSVPDVRAVVRRLLKDNPALGHDDVVALCTQLWAQPVHEHRVAAVEVLASSHRALVAADVVWLERLLREAGTWALVDDLARKVVARLVLADPLLLGTLDRWLVDDDFWIRRSAVLGLTELLRDGRELDRFFRYGDTLLAEKEFFIRKVLGWVARGIGRRHPDDVSAWLRRNLDRMNGVTIREAVKYLPDGAEILAEWDRRKSSARRPRVSGPGGTAWGSP